MRHIDYIYIQFIAILKKNFLLQWKQVKSNLIQLFFMIGIMIILILISKKPNYGYQSADSKYIYLLTPTSNQPEVRNVLGKYWVVDPPTTGGNTPSREILQYLPISEYNITSSLTYTVPNITYFPSTDYDQMDSRAIQFKNDSYPFWAYYRRGSSFSENSLDKLGGGNVSHIPPYYTIYFNQFVNDNSGGGGVKKLNYTLENLYDRYRNSAYYYSLFLEDYTDNKAMTIISYINNAYLQYLTNNKHSFSATKQQYEDTYYSYKPSSTTSFVACIILLPPLVSMIFTTFVHSLVSEKSEQHMALMSLMGLDITVYMLSNAVYFFCLYMVWVVIVFLMGTIGLVPLFLHEFPRLFILFIFYGLSLVSMSFIVSAFFSSTKMSSVLSYMLILITPIIGTLWDLFSYSGQLLSGFYLIYSPFTFQHGMYLLTVHLSDSYKKFHIDSQFAIVIISLLFQSIIFFLIGVYLNNIIPKKYGYSRSPLYPIKALIEFYKNKTKKKSGSSYSNLREEELFPQSEDIQQHNYEEDPDLQAERKKAYNIEEDLILRAVNVSKSYRSGKVTKKALSNFCLTGKEGEILALLGPNGSGKTTFLSLLCGIYRPTGGEVFIDKHKITTEMESIYPIVSICCQQDILYDDLTVYQHMEFFYSLKKRVKNDKNTRAQVMKRRQSDINQILENTILTEESLVKVKNLSGGQRRRLSIAISLIGDSKLLLLDEPTTGVSAELKRTCWDIIKSIKTDKTIILTTHSLEEANALADKIAIISSGELQCIGTSVHLKNRFGSGFCLDIILYAAQFKLQLIDSVITQIPDAQLKETIIPDEVTFIIPNQADIIKLFSILNENKEQYGIKSWSVSHSSLDDVFNKIVNAREVIQ